MTESYERLAAAAGAIARARDAPSLERALEGDTAEDWASRMLLLGLALTFGSAPALERLRALASPGCEPIRPPVAILAGGTDARIEAEMRAYRDLVLAAFAGFSGTLVSGGTAAGIAGLAAEVGAAYPERVWTIGYLPAAVPPGVAVDRRYRELRRTSGERFSPIEPLQCWTDLAASGVSPEHVCLLGIDGGAVSAAEYRIGLALGARVGLIAGSGREADRLLADEEWSRADRLTSLPARPDAVNDWVTPAGRRV